MKHFMALSLIVAAVSSSAAQAEDTKVEITSFTMAGSRTRAAEICGKVSGMTEKWLAVRITVDPKSDRPGVYNTLAGQDGRFCTAVVTYVGQAEASVGWGENQTLSNTAQVAVQESR